MSGSNQPAVGAFAFEAGRRQPPGCSVMTSQPVFGTSYFGAGWRQPPGSWDLIPGLQNDVRCAADLEESLRLCNKSETRYRLGCLYYSSEDKSVGDVGKALKVTEKLQNMEPPTQETSALIAAIFAEVGDFDAAVKWETMRCRDLPKELIPKLTNLAAYQQQTTSNQFRILTRTRLSFGNHPSDY